jgi:hypothetical protein
MANSVEIITQLKPHQLTLNLDWLFIVLRKKKCRCRKNEDRKQKCTPSHLTDADDV